MKREYKVLKLQFDVFMLQIDTVLTAWSNFTPDPRCYRKINCCALTKVYSHYIWAFASLICKKKLLEKLTDFYEDSSVGNVKTQTSSGKTRHYYLISCWKIVCPIIFFDKNLSELSWLSLVFFQLKGFINTFNSIS